jgi:WhiB family redox-sensing transcriptional regulator
MNWRERAACRYEDPKLFFPVGDGGLSVRQVEEARTVCRRCPVLRDCRSWALHHAEYEGIWGGLTAAERRMVARRRLPERDRS